MKNLLNLFVVVAGLSSCARQETIQNVTAAEAATLLASEAPPIIVDLRTPEEFNEGHLKGAVLINFKGDDFEARLSDLDREKAYLFHCRSGSRSSKSLPVWRELGFSELYHLDKGYVSWVDAGLPVVED